jgi:CheY-like chemotaxis protein
VKCILVVEDHHDVRDTMCDLLGALGYHATPAADGQEALEVMAGGDPLPDLILLDLMMPVMDGWEFRQQQMSEIRWSQIPVVVLTAIAETVTEMGVVPILRKPIDVEHLVILVEAFVGKGERG